jgi:ribulose-5-phosphate 4-epimerase/fuculose-1-phosphate aldolase
MAEADAQDRTLDTVPAANWTPAETRARRKRDVALGYRILAGQRWGDLGDGHISARDPEQQDCFWMLRYGVSYHAARVADLVLVGPDGRLVEGEGFVNEAGYFIHHALHAARPDIISAAHVHTPWGTPFSAELRPLEPITQEACIFFEDHAIFDDEEVQIQSVAAGARIAEALGSNSSIILRNHGLLTTGNAVSEAVGLFVTMERVAESHMKARNAKPVSAEAARFAKADLVKNGAGRVGFHALVARHIGDASIVD